MKDSYIDLPQSFTDPSLLSRLEKTEPILVAFSGGADSSALLHILCRYSKQNGTKIYAAHVNHGIRGEEADRDEEFCRKLCGSLGVEIFILRADVPSIAKERKESVETAARNVRYDFFECVMRENGIKILATAHNANDNLETLIFNMARGSGLSGMCGIPDSRPIDCGVVIRPMLAMEKSEIIEYCKEHSLDFVTDSTNTDTDYTRNLIRAEIIPIMQKINSGALKNASRMCKNLREDSLCLDNIAEQLIDKYSDGYAIDLKHLSTHSNAIVNRAIIKLYNTVSSGESLEQAHVKALQMLARRAVPHSATSLPLGLEGVVENGKLYVVQRRENTVISDYKVELFDGKNTISQTNSEIFIGNSQNAKNVYKNETILYIDFDKISGKLFARPRAAGDKIKMNGMSKSVKKLMCEKKIPLELRNTIPVICDDLGIVAIPFIGVCDKVATKDKNDKNIFRFCIH